MDGIEKPKFSARERIAQFFADWSRSRDFSLVMRFLPALVLGILLAAGICFSVTQSPFELGAKYAVRAKHAWAFGRLETADLYYRKSLAEWPDTVDVVLENAQVAHLLEDYSRRDALISRLIDEFQSPLGLLLRAELLLQQDFTPESVREIGVLLAQARSIDATVSHGDQNSGLRRRLAMAHEMLGNREEALSQFEAIPNRTTLDQLAIALLWHKLGKVTEAKELVASLLDKTDEPLVVLPRAQAYTILGDSQAALAQIRVAIASARLFPEERDQVIRTAMQCFVGFWPSTESERLLPLEFLEAVVTMAPARQDLAKVLIILAGLVPSADLGALDPAQMNAAIASTEAPVIAHLLKGLALLPDDDAAGKRELHFRLACRIRPGSSLLLSRCSQLLVKPNLALAARLNEAALTLTERHPFSVEVQGQILIASGEPQAAVDLLTEHLSGHRRGIYTLLIQAHQALGEEAMVADYRDRLAELDEDQPEGRED